ncbi:MAG: hypothetical protein FJZ16_04245, partial [Candidatus Omnitrophica bacterium]|nr:hypothetical protein [Candidatus Omnitrophota bacterium]
MTTKGYHFLSIMLILVISFSFSCFTQAQEQGKDFWGGPTTPFTKSSVESINKWGSPLQRKLSQIVTHAIYNSIWDPKEWNAFGAKHDFGAFLKNSANDKSYPQSAQILEPDDPTTYPPQTSDNFFISPNRPFKKFIDILHTKECFVTGGVSCDLVDIRDGWWLRFFPDMFLQPGKLNLRTEGGKRYLIHYALAQVAAGCDAIWYYKQLSPNIVKNSLFNLEDWARLIKETKDYTYKAYGREALVGGTGLYNEYVDYQTDNMFEYFYSPYNRPYE